MELKSIQCPSCGANLNVENINQSLFYCQYCGAAVQLETNRNKGYDMEHGRLDARAEMADTVLGEIEEIKSQLLRNGQANYDKTYLPSVITESKSKQKSSLTFGLKEYVLKGFLKGVGGLFLGSILMTTILARIGQPLYTLLGFVVLLAPIYVPIIGIVKLVKQQKQIKSQIEHYEKELQESRKALEETDNFLAKNAKVEIPRRFRHEAALNYIIKGLKAREFISLEQALFKCEEAMARNEINDLYAGF